MGFDPPRRSRIPERRGSNLAIDLPEFWQKNKYSRMEGGMRYALAIVISILSVGMATGSHAATQTFSYSGTGNATIGEQLLVLMGGPYGEPGFATITANIAVSNLCSNIETDYCGGNASSMLSVMNSSLSGETAQNFWCWGSGYQTGCSNNPHQTVAGVSFIRAPLEGVWFFWYLTFSSLSEDFSWEASVILEYPDPEITPIETPLPATLPLLAGILGGGVALGLRRRWSAVPNVPVA